METDPSYKKSEVCNIDGKLFWGHLTSGEKFCHFKIVPQHRFWISKNVSPHLGKLLFCFLLSFVAACILLHCEVGKIQISILVTSVLMYIYLHLCYVVEENLVCVKDFGIQMSTIYFTGRILREFIPATKVADCVINEVIFGQRIIFVITVLVSKTEDIQNYEENKYSKIEKAVTLFKGTKPRLKTLSQILKEIHRVLFNEHKSDYETYDEDEDIIDDDLPTAT